METAHAPPLPDVIPYNPDKVRDAVRGRIALSLIAILGVTVVWSLWLIYAAPWHTERLVEVLKLLFGPLTTLVGAATGYYYGAGSGSAQANAAGKPAGPK